MKTELTDVTGNRLLIREYVNADGLPRMHLLAIEGSLTFSMALSPESASALVDFMTTWLQDVAQREGAMS